MISFLLQLNMVMTKTGQMSVWSIFLNLKMGFGLKKAQFLPPNNYASQIFSHDISASENYLTIGTTGVGNGGLAYVYQMGQDGSEWDLVSTLGSTEVNSSNPSLFSIAMGKGQIIMGLPEDSEGQNLGGSIQTFINAVGNKRGAEVPTNDNGSLDNGFFNRRRR